MSLSIGDASGAAVVVASSESPEGFGFRNPGGKKPEIVGAGLILLESATVVAGISGPAGIRNPGGKKPETSSFLTMNFSSGSEVVGATKSSGRRFRNPGGRNEMMSVCLAAGVADVVGASKFTGSKLATSAAFDLSSSFSNSDRVVGFSAAVVVVVNGDAVVDVV